MSYRSKDAIEENEESAVQMGAGLLSEGSRTRTKKADLLTL